MPDTHAVLSASAAKRWLNCPPSARLTENMPDTQSEYASEGTLAHAVAELKVRKKFDVMSKSMYDKLFAPLKANELYQPEMDGYTTDYLDYILAIAHSYRKAKPYVAAEKRLDYSHIAPEGFGTCDCVMMCGNDLHIIDFKYGKGVAVSAKDNPQLKLYALGALNEYSLLYDIKNVELHIVQPRIADGNSSWSLSAADLIAWGEDIKPLAELAHKGEGTFKSGDWCRFCKAKAVCRTRAEYFLAVEDVKDVPPELLSDSELGDVLTRAGLIKNWAADVEKYALSEILKGNSISGWKAVEGRSNRKITDIDKAFEILEQNGYPKEMLYEPKPLTLTALEELMPKKTLDGYIGDLIVKPAGAPTLAPVSDKRAEYKPENKNDLNEMFGGD